MRAIQVTCPHCGARVPVTDASTVTCEYCGTSSRVQRRTTVLERVLPPPVAGPRTIAVQTHTPRYGVTLVLGLLLPLGIGGFVAFTAIRQANRAVELGNAVAAQAKERAVAPAWQGGRALTVDIDGNGTLDLVGRTRRVLDQDTVRLIALDGATGKPLWETEPLGSYSDTYQGLLALDEDQLVFASPRAELRAFAVRTGAATWTARLDERVERFCRDGDRLLAVGTDEVVRPLGRADGVVGQAEAPPATKRNKASPACAALPVDKRSFDRGADYELGRAVGISPRQLVSGPGGRVLSGTRETGTRVAMLVALDDKRGARWKVVVPQDPLGVTESPAEHAVVGEHATCAAYYGKSIVDPMRVACFALDDGRRLWDQQVTSSSVHALLIVDAGLVVSSGNTLERYDLATGAVAWRFGQ